jgi:hypothetical protein
MVCSDKTVAGIAARNGDRGRRLSAALSPGGANAAVGRSAGANTGRDRLDAVSGLRHTSEDRLSKVAMDGAKALFCAECLTGAATREAPPASSPSASSSLASSPPGSAGGGRDALRAGGQVIRSRVNDRGASPPSAIRVVCAATSANQWAGAPG